MAGRCGCASGCGCIAQAIPPLVLEGTGEPGDPFKLSLMVDGEWGCRGVRACVGSHLGPGLVYDPVTTAIGLKVSADAGNIVEIRPDGGVYSPGPSTPVEIPCIDTISELPAFCWGGTHGGAGYVKAFGSVGAAQYALDFNLDIVEVDVGTTVDGVSCPVRRIHEQSYGTFTNMINVNPSDEIADFSANEWTGTWVAHGGPVEPRADQTVSTAWPKSGGWYGFLEATENLLSLEQWIQMIRARAVVIVNCGFEPLGQTAESVHIAAAIRTIQQTCSQEWAMVEYWNLGNTQQVIDGGVTPVYRVTSATTPTAAEAFTAGVRWAVIDYTLAESVHTAWKAAGIQVLMRTSGRQYHSGRAQTLALRGVLAPDPVYARGTTEANRVYYRRQSDLFRTKRRMTGTLNRNTDSISQTGSVPSIGYYPLATDPGPAIGTNIIWDSSFIDSTLYSGFLLGWMSPIRPDWTDYTLAWTQHPQGTANANSRFGACVGMVDDRPVQVQTLAEVTVPFYACFVRHQGALMGIEYVETGGATTLVSAAITNFNNLPCAMEVRVSAAQINFRMSVNGGAVTQVTTTDTRARGRYASLFKTAAGSAFTVYSREVSVRQGIA